MKVFVDTNILIDLVCLRTDFLQDAKTLFAYAYIGKIDITLSALSFVNAMYLAHRYGLSNTEMKNSLSKIANFSQIVDLSGDIIEWALVNDWRDYEDATQYKSALLSTSDCIVTRNKKDFLSSSLPVYSVSELLKIMQTEGK